MDTAGVPAGMLCSNIPIQRYLIN